MNSLVPIPRPESAPTLRQRSAVATLAAAGVIGADEVEAAWRFAALWHEMTDRRSPFDLVLGIESVPTTERATAAKQRLQQIRQETGSYGFELLVRVAVEGYALRDLFIDRRPRDTDRKSVV